MQDCVEPKPPQRKNLKYKSNKVFPTCWDEAVIISTYTLYYCNKCNVFMTVTTGIPMTCFYTEHGKCLLPRKGKGLMVKWDRESLQHMHQWPTFFTRWRMSFTTVPFKMCLFVCLSYRQGYTWYNHTPSLEWISIWPKQQQKKEITRAWKAFLTSKYVNVKMCKKWNFLFTNLKKKKRHLQDKKSSSLSFTTLRFTFEPASKHFSPNSLLPR